ncbi:MAG: sodium/solute symporter, partial [Bacteroidota bacterium]
IDLQLIIVGVAIIAGIYTIAGGLSSVVYTDAVQAVILIIGSTLITVFAYQQVGGWEPVYAEIADPTHFDIIKPVSDEALPWPGLFTGVLLIGFYFWGTNQYITQRTLAAKSVREGQWGSMFAGFLKLSILFIMIFPGALARVLYPNMENLDLIYPTMLFDLLPTGVLGFVLAGLIAAMMSSLDSGLNSVSTLITMDFYQKIKPQATPKDLMKIGRVITVIIMVIAIFWAPQIGSFPKLWDYLQQTLAWFSPPVVALFVGGLFFKRSNAQGAYACIGIGLVLTVALIGNAVSGGSMFDLPNFLYVAGIHFAICFGALWVVSRLTPPPSEEAVRTMVWTPAVFREETLALAKLPWYKNYRYQAMALCIVVTIILIAY